MKELDGIIDNLNAVVSKADIHDRLTIDNLIEYAELCKKQFSETVKKLSDSSNKLIKKINSTSSVKGVE